MLELPELEQRLSNLQSEVERLWRKAEANVPPVEQRLAAMADQYAEYLKRWASTVERHTHAVTQLESYAREWKDASSRVRQETAERLHELESTIEREWDTLRRMHEEPVRELREQAESLAQVSLAVASASQTGLDRAEARFATFENEVHVRLNELTRELQTAITEMKARIDRQQGRLDPAAQWSLDDVTRLHGQLRDGANATGDVPHTIEHSAVARPRELPGGESTDQPAVTRQNGGRRSVDQARAPSQGMPRKWAAMVAAFGAIAVLAALFLWRMQGQLTAADERARIRELRADAAVTDAARQSEEARRLADEQIGRAREMATRAQTIADVLAAPDLIRYNLRGDNGASGQALFSRSRGFVVSGSRLPSAPPNVAHQVWLLTRVAPVKAGTLAPEPDGTVTLVQQAPDVPRAVVGVMVTEEPSTVGENPTGAAVLTSVVRAAPAQETAQP